MSVIKKLEPGLSKGDIFIDDGRQYQIAEVYENGTYSSFACNDIVYNDSAENVEQNTNLIKKDKPQKTEGELRELDLLREKAKSLGITVQKMWGIKQLQNKIEKAENI